MQKTSSGLRQLCQDGFVQRYTMTEQTQHLDGLPPGEATFLPCTFWLADSYLLAGRVDEGREVFQRLLGLRNDLGSLSEEYDTHTRRLIGNFPQALTHLALVNTALACTPTKDQPTAGPTPGGNGERARRALDLAGLPNW